ncbi:shikimate dehydrogenase [Candidatus Peregrinibacteria bacterium]|nr:shikimate dehydrogenase [Candidatus Peregrinibacteria bacterium]
MDIYGILGHPTGHSLSPILHNAAFRALGIHARFEIFDVAPSRLPAFFKRMRRAPIHGLAVSLPYKERVLEYLDSFDSSTQKIGAVNTVYNENGVLRGFNTDFSGAISALTKACSATALHELRGKTVVVIGAGGAARAIVYGLQQEGAEVIILNRTQSKADTLARDFGCQSGELSTLFQWQPNILINATSVGMEPNIESISCDPHYFRVAPRHLLVFDIVYRPRITQFLRLAQEAGLSILTGDSMLLHQGAVQFKIWTGKSAPISVMKKTLDEALCGLGAK